MVLYMDRKMKRWELALMCGVLCALALGGWLDREQERLADQVIRLHVIANSDSPEDQALKLEVRDQVLAHAEELYPAGADRTAAAAAIQEHLPELAAAGQRVLEERGCDYAVRAELTETWFPTKEYERLCPSGRRIHGPAGGHRRGSGAELVVRGLPAPVLGCGQRDGGGGGPGGTLHR